MEPLVNSMWIQVSSKHTIQHKLYVKIRRKQEEKKNN